MVLRIYKLDVDGDPVSELKDGEHIIGRGKLLQCDDRRVSRNHGVLKITQDEATLTSTHINPCFYQGAGSTTIIILKQGNPMSLNDGDKFALLADQYWYKIGLGAPKVMLDDRHNHDVTNNDDSMCVTKRLFEEETSPTCSKKIKTEGDEADVLNMSHEIDNIHDKTVENKFHSVLHDLHAEASYTFNNQTENQEYNKPQTKHKRKPQTSLEPTRHDAKLREMLFSSDEEDNGTVESSNQEPTKDNITNNQNANENISALPSSTKREVMSDSDSDVPSELKNAKVPASSTQNRNQTNIKDDKDQENCSNSNTKHAATNQDPSCSSDDTNKPGPSDTNTKKHRDRCWYGIKCYRKNIDHLSEYSHPGDSDFDSDPNDNRPVCSFGADCYRRNKGHREAYKHPKGVKKPPGTKKKRKAAKQKYNETPEDDYDLDDPFIDDSGSEYETESDSDDSDSNWSEASEEGTKRLIKEAKRFTKGKKKDQDDD